MSRRVVVLAHQLDRDLNRQTAKINDALGLWRAIRDLGDEVIFLCPSSEAAMDEGLRSLSEPGLSVEPRRPVFRSPLLLRYAELVDELRFLNPSGVHLVGEPWQAGAISATKAAGRLNVPVGLHFAENGPALEHLVGVLRRVAGRHTFKRLTYAIGWSTATANLAREAWGFGGHVDVFPGVGVPREFFAAAGSYERRSAVIFIGRLSPEKGIRDFLRLARRLGDSVPKLVVGDGPLRDEVDTAARDGLVEYLGAVERSQVAALLGQALVTVVPSLPGVLRSPMGYGTSVAEQFGRVTAESMAAGTPVVAYDTGALSESIGPGGLVVPAGDFQALVTAVQDLLENSAERERLSSCGRTWATRFSESALAGRLTDVWRKLAI